MVNIGVWELVGIIGILSIICFFGSYFAKRKPEWDNNARKIKKELYEEMLLKRVNEFKKFVESCTFSELSFAIDKTKIFNCILRRKTRESLTKLEEQLISYKKAQSLAVLQTRIILEDVIRRKLSDLRTKVESGSIKILNTDSLEKVFIERGYLHEGPETYLQHILEESINYDSFTR